MKRVIQICTSILLGVVTLLLSSCEKKDSPGPSNVNATTFVISSSQWSWKSPDHYVSLSVPELTSSNINSAAVMVYCDTDGEGWRAVPYTQYTNNSNYFMSFKAMIGIVKVTWVYNNSLSSGDNPSVFYNQPVKFKVVVIPAGARMDLDLTDYEAVKDAFELKD